MPTLCLLADRASRELGGAAAIAHEHARGLAGRGWRVILIRASREGAPEPMRVDGFVIHELRSRYPQSLRYYFNLYNYQTIPHLKRLLAEYRPDIVHAHNIHLDLSYAALAVARRFAKGVFLTTHDVGLFYYGRLGTHRYLQPGNLRVRDDFDYRTRWYEVMRAARLEFNPLRRFFIRRALTCVRRIFPVSDALREALRQNSFTNTETIHNGIDASLWQSAPAEVAAFRERFGLAGKKVILWAGRLRSDKGAKQLLEALALIIKDIPQTALLVAGERTGYGETFLAQARRQQLGAHVCVTGWLTPLEIRAAYGVADVVAVPSIVFDSFPNVVLEAMAAAKPVVATCFGGSREAVVHGETGFIVNPFDVSSLADCLRELLLDAERAQVFGRAGLARVRSQFSLTQYLDTLEKHYALALHG
ncbi:glycosyltransferase family 4 protein [Candidatus Parcubacteria bacterium]|nr:glycosyltransferase family 4 protein [Candidatus Parcubacteria bacterium]